jgi:DNA-binding IclR family transcriptional regulator
MQAARNETGVAVVLSVPTTTSAFVLSTCASNQQIEIGVRPGSQLQLHSSAQGKVFLAFGAPNLLEGLKGADLPAVTPRTITKYEELVADIERVRKRGFATAPEESLLGVRAIAAPVYDYSDKVVGSIGLIGSVQHIHEEPQPEMLEALLKLTKAVSVALGHEKAH